MEPIRVITGTAAPLDRSDVDTDQIIPASWLKRVERTGFGIGLFSAWRENDPDFVLNRPEYAGASILVAGPNFGIGSSREHAVWALTDYGFRAVISPRFGDIFRNNATKTGLLPIVVSPEFSEALMRAVDADPGLVITIDVAEGWISAPGAGLDTDFPLDEFTRHRLLEGLDDIGISLQHADKITAFEARRPDWMPRVLQG
ncbi:MAG TPA: 3-isopropylmalate dehydratase small subunit [Thermomicrobiales bacterium]|nr:3-isopropylmalate dehydratase small subunit [Thermomicrobiales bacterium]